MLHLLVSHSISSLTTLPTLHGWFQVVGITAATTLSSGLMAVASGFIDPVKDFDPPRNIVRPAYVLIFPALAEEVFWRGTLLTAALTTLNYPDQFYKAAVTVLILHVCFHPVAANTVWPRGKGLFDDPRFLLLAFIVLGGATCSFLVTGGSAWAAALTHGVPVALWRDVFSGEKKLASI